MMKLKKIKHLKQGGKDMKKQYFNPPDRRKRKKITIKTVKAGIMSSVMAAVTAATTVAAPILSYAADLTETDSSAQTQTITNDDGTQTILNTSEGNETADGTGVSGEDEAEETRFLFLKLKTTGGKIVIDKGEDEEHTVRLVKHKSEDGKTDEEKIDVYDKDDVLVSSEDAAKNNYTYAYEVKSDSVANVKAEADEGYVLKKYEVKAGDANKKADLNADDVSDSHEQAIFMDENKTVDVEFEKSSEDDAGVTDETTQTADEDVSDDCADDTTADNNTNEDADVNDDKEKDEDISVDDSVRKGADAETEDVESKADAASVDDDLSVVDPEEDKAESEAETAVDENDTDDVTEAGDEELTTDAEAADDSETTDTGESADETVEEHFLEKADGVDELNADEFASARLIVMTDTESGIVDKEHLIGAYGSIYLLQYKDAAQAMNAYMYYKENAEAVEPDAKITAASETDEVDVTDETKAMTKDDNAVAVLNNEESSSKVSVYSGNSRGKVIALIDTGASESKNVIDRVSLIDDVLNGGTHGDDMVSNIVSQDSDAKILSIRALGNDGYGTYSAVVSAVEYAINSGVGIINLSMYSPKTLATSVLEAEIQKAIDDGITVVGAAGNDGKDAAGYVPGAIDDAYIIGAATTDGIRVAKSNYGQAVDYYVAADTTSEAAAQFTGYVSKNGLDAAKDGEDGLIFTSVANCTTDVDPKDDNISEDKDDSTIYDPVIENYIKSHVDKNYVGEGKLTLVNAIDVDATIASADELNEGETIDSLMSSDDFRFLTQQTGRVPVYQLNNDSEYFVAFVDVMHNDKKATALDYEIARNDVTGTSIEGTHYDKDSGLLYIPKKAYYGEDGKYYFQYLQVQILYSITNYDINTTWNSAVISTTERKDGEKESNISGSNIIDMRMAVQVGRNMNVNSMLVNVNGLPIEGKYYSYNPKTGILIIGFSSAVVQSIWVEAEKDKDAPDVEPGMVSAKTDFEGMICVASGTVSVDYDKVRKGYAFESTIDMIYPEADGSNWEGVKSSDVIAYRCQTGSDDTLHNALINYIFSKTDSLGFLQDGCVYQPVPGMFYPFVLRLNTIHCNDIRFSDVIAGTNHAKLDIEKPFGDKNGVVVNQVTKPWKIGTYIKKVDEDGRPLAGAEFTVYSDDGLTDDDVVGKLVTGDDGISNTLYVDVPAKADNITLYCKETKAPNGYKLVKTVYSQDWSVEDATANGEVKQMGPVDGVVNGDGWSLRYKIRKIDRNGNGLPDAEFTIYTDKELTNSIATLTTDDEGWTDTNTLMRMSKVKSQTLYCVETQSPEGYYGTDEVYEQTWTHDEYKSYVQGGGDEAGVEKTFNGGGVVNDKAWSIRANVKKVDETGWKLGGAEFGIYTNQSCSEDSKIGSLVTDDIGSNGHAKEPFAYELPESTNEITLYCKETKAPNGYELNKAIYSQKWTYEDYKNLSDAEKEAGGKVEDFGPEGGVPNKKIWEVAFWAKKVDENGVPLAGAVFSVYTDKSCKSNSCIETLTTKADGTTSYGEFIVDAETEQITLYCKETKAPSGYVLDDKVYEQTWTKKGYLEDMDSEIKQFGPETGIVNHEGWRVRVNIKKIDERQDPLAGAVFGVYTDKSCTDASKVGELKSGKDGMSNILTYEAAWNKESVTLYCKEISAPEGYDKAEDIFSLDFNKSAYLTLKKTKNDTTGELKPFGPKDGVINLDSKPVTVKIHKTSTAASEILGLSGYSLEGAEFKVTGNGITGILKTDAKGESNTLELPNKTAEYTITETKAPKGHKLDSTPKTLKVTMPNDRGKDFVIDFKDEPIFTTNTFQITKKSEKGNVIKGVLFKVEFLDNNATKKTWYLVSDEKGLVKMDMSYTSKEAAYKSDAFYTHNNKVVVPISGKLKVTEIKAPAQYAVDNTPKYLTTSQNDKLEVEMVNTLKPCKINIRKFDADGKTPLKGVSFELKFVKETEKLTATKNGFTRLLKVGGAITKDTDANGNIVFDNLDQGEYQLTEIRTTAGHTLLKDPISITLPITMSQDEAKKNNADTSKATLDAGYTDNWFFYDCKYEVTNTAVFKLPMTGSDGDWKYGIIGFGTLAVLGTGLILMDTRKKRIMNSRKQKRRRK